MATKLTNGILLVNGESSDIYEVQIGNVLDNMFVEIHLIPNENTRSNGLEGDIILCDMLNQTVIHALQQEGYKVIQPEDVVYIENSEW